MDVAGVRALALQLARRFLNEPHNRKNEYNLDHLTHESEQAKHKTYVLQMEVLTCAKKQTTPKR